MEGIGMEDSKVALFEGADRERGLMALEVNKESHYRHSLRTRKNEHMYARMDSLRGWPDSSLKDP